ncbi:type VII secretion protein EsaA [Virgibacillus dakarensis]|nr:type VII secretion protein EsaA [Virgibacillus dakarensis]
MKKGFKQLILFLVLMVVLASGSSYLSLNHVTKSKNAKDVQTMAIALVNEDEGATFNNNDLSFGDAFVKSLDKNNEHDWYVVSRGVAESGLERNTYDMMVVIPNDFSEKALSISSEAPEHVVLNYKINASGNKNFQAEAEKTASSILNDFNRRIIDVYFASVIGNLQEAQDNIGEVVKEEALYTNTYNNSIHNPLANYTDQFSNVKDSAKTSKDSFSGLEDTLGTFGKQLSDDANMNQDYLSSMSDTSKLLENNSVLSMNFVKQLNQFNAGLNSGHVEEQLRNLQTANNYINYQFGKSNDSSENTDTIMSYTNRLQAFLNNAYSNVEKSKQNVDKTLEQVAIDLSKMLDDAFGNNEKIGYLFRKYDETSKQKIREQIEILASLNEEDIDELDLPDNIATELKNVIAVTNKYIEEIDPGIEPPEGSNQLEQQVWELKNHLNKRGVIANDSEKLKHNDDKDYSFTFKIPEEYELKWLSLTLPSGKKVNRPGNEKDKVYNVTLKGPLDQGDFIVEAKLELIDTENPINVFQPVTWNWTLKPINTNDDGENYTEHASIQEPNIPLIANTSTDGSDKVNEDNDSKNTKDEDTTSSPRETDQNPHDPKEDKNQSEETDKNESNNTNNDETNKVNKPEDQKDSNSGDENRDPDGSGSNEGNDKDEEEEPVEEKMSGYYSHKIMEPVEDLDSAVEQLINAVNNTVRPYQKLQPLYEMYLGLDMDLDLREEIGKGSSFREMAGERSYRNSLYYLYNETNFGELLTDELVRGVINQIREPFKNQINNFYDQVSQVNGYVNGDEEKGIEGLAAQVAATANQAAILNDNLAKTLEDITKWREQSLQLLEQQSEIQANNEEEHTAVMTLGSEFQPLLMSSQTLAEQAQTNLNSAENVYQTFDNIDEQASQIQQSGTNLVSKAGELSVNMTNNLLEDQEFADNFADVLANSRIGDRQNEDLYDFLSNPVQTKNNGTIVAGDDKFTPYFLVLVCFIVALFTAYVISTNNQRRIADDQFESEKSLMGKNTLITTITGSIGVAEGIIIGLLSGYFLHISEGELIKWTGLITLVMVVMLLVATYLLRQLKMIGMFILLVVLSLYLFLTKALGSGIAGLETLRMYSPLQHVETLISKTALGATSYGTGVFVLLGLALIGVLANLLVLYRTARKGEEDDERVAEAN